MQMTLRWYGSKYDTVTLKQIRQIPGVTGVISTLYGTAPGEVWEMDDILALKAEIEAAGLQLAGIESVNIHDAIKIGSPDREQYIENYITTLERLGQAGIHMVCYNFMPVFDWTRTELARMRPDGSTVLAYNQAAVDAIDPAKMFESIAGDMNGTVMPGWEPERMAHVKELFEMYKDVDDEKLFANLKYFLERIMPTCDKYDINMAIHPDDPAWSVFGLPRIIINKQNILRMMKLVDNPHNGVLHDGPGEVGAHGVVAVEEGEHLAGGPAGSGASGRRCSSLGLGEDLDLEVRRGHARTPRQRDLRRRVRRAVVDHHHLQRSPRLRLHARQTPLQQLRPVVHRDYHTQLHHCFLNA